MKKRIKYFGTLTFFLIGSSIILYQKADNSPIDTGLSQLTLGNIEALSLGSPETEGSRIPCSKQNGEYCYFRIWDADGKYINSNTWKNYVYSSSDPTH